VRRAELPGPIARGPHPLRAALVRRASNWDAAAKRVVHRTFDLMGVGVVIIILAPLLLLRAIIAVTATGRVFDRQVLLGRWRVPFERLRFAGSFPGRSLGVLANIARGDLSWTGPRPLSEAEAAIVPARAWVRFRIRPGLVSTYVLRARVGRAYEDENSTDRDFFYSQTVGGSVGVLARALPSAILGRPAPGAATSELRFFGVDIANTTMDEAIDWIVRRAKGGIKSQLCFVNPDCLNLAYDDSEYQRVLQQADRVLPDGIGIHIACRISGTPLVANVNGTDLFPRICERAAAEDLSLFLLGSAPGCAEASARNMRLKFGSLKIAGTRSGYFQASDEAALLDEINRSSADILLVGLGAPRQEVWIANNRSRLRPAMTIGVGGLFDFYSERIARAPSWMREIGMEWSWRLIMEPRRMWRRYLVGNPLFLFRVWRESRLAAQTIDSHRD
jgi:N-acetylglucosaminyldiphosphoundecaprenol N-acetyl-beta-D-mannosaminyltransferase